MNTITINKRAYKILPMRADEQAQLGLELLPLVTGPIGSLLRSKDINISSIMLQLDDGGFENMEEAELFKIVAVFMDLIPQIDMKTMFRLFLQALESVSCIDGKLSDEPTRDIYFQQNPEDYYPVCIWALWRNTQSFLVGAIPGIKEIFLGSEQSPLPAQSQMNGPSNGSSRPSTRQGSAPMQTLRKSE